MSYGFNSFDRAFNFDCLGSFNMFTMMEELNQLSIDTLDPFQNLQTSTTSQNYDDVDKGLYWKKSQDQRLIENYKKEIISGFLVVLNS